MGRARANRLPLDRQCKRGLVAQSILYSTPFETGSIRGVYGVP